MIRGLLNSCSVRCVRGDRRYDRFLGNATQRRGRSNEEKIAALAAIVCRAGDKLNIKSAALLVLMARRESSRDPKALANRVKHVVFTCCGELNLKGMVDAQVARLEGELLTAKALTSYRFRLRSRFPHQLRKQMRINGERSIMRQNLTKGPHMSNTDLISIERIEKAIYLIRGEKVMLDRDLAKLYGVMTGALNQAVRRNRDRFPEDFMFQLTEAEVAQLNLSQTVIGSEKHRDPRLRPYAFTKQGVAMLSTVLRSKCAITVNIEIMRTFVKLRQMLASNAELARRLEELESKYDKQFKVVFDAIRHLMASPIRDRKEIGFRSRAVKRRS